jgi:hypothetical protein
MKAIDPRADVAPATTRPPYVRADWSLGLHRGSWTRTSAVQALCAYMTTRSRYACTVHVSVPGTHVHVRTCGDPCKCKPSSTCTGSTGASLHQLLQEFNPPIKFHGVPRQRCRRSPKRSKLHQPCKCYYHYNIMCRSTSTRRTTQAGMAHILAMLYRLMDRRGHGHADATTFYINTTCMET